MIWNRSVVSDLMGSRPPLTRDELLDLCPGDVVVVWDQCALLEDGPCLGMVIGVDRGDSFAVDVHLALEDEGQTELSVARMAAGHFAHVAAWLLEAVPRPADQRWREWCEALEDRGGICVHNMGDGDHYHSFGRAKA